MKTCRDQYSQSGLLLDEPPTTTPEAAPDAFAPVAPMLLRTPCNAMGPSVAIKLSIAARFAFCKDGVVPAQHDESRPAAMVKIFDIDKIMMKANNMAL